MANHVRQQIREAVATQLTGLTTTGSNVFQSRVYGVPASSLPCLLIYSVSEQSEPTTLTRPRGLQRMLTLAVEARVRAASNFDDTIDTICKEVEAAMYTGGTFSGLAKTAWLDSTEITLSGDGDQPQWSALMRWSVMYLTAENAADVAT